MLLPFAGMVALVHAGCGDAVAPPADQSNDRVAIVNDAAALAARVTVYATDVPVPVVSGGVGYPTPTPAPAASGPSLSVQSPAGAAGAFKLMLRAEVAPPSIDGQVLQATSVAIVGDKAVVSYNMRGEQYLGAIDVFDISNRNKPVLRSEALFRNTDVNAVSTYGGLLVAAEATGDTGFAAPAAVEVMMLVGPYLVLNDSWRLPLTSYAGTSVTVSRQRAYATSGDGGALFAFDVYPQPTIDTVPLHDARWVTVDRGMIVVAQGTPGTISVFDETTLAPVGTFSFTGADIPESKSTVDLVGGKAFIAAGTGGVQVLNVSTGTVVGAVQRPDPAALGLDPSVVVTNAAAADESLLFISNGEAGVYVAEGSRNFTDMTGNAPQQITMLGRLQFGSLQSVNHVAYRDKTLIIAAGLGGLKIVQVVN
jgi:outer membrane protein assembly factor BamB